MNRLVLTLLFITFIGFSHTGRAGFLEMPVITEMPDLERKSMLKDLDIPSVRDRDPDPESGPRLNVVKFKLQGIVEYPDLDITKKDIDRLIEGLRYNLMQEYDVLDSGFTEKELEEVSKMLVEIEEETMDRHVSDLEVQKLVWLVREQRLQRGITLGTIETIADRITRFYRERGFILAKAYIPEQQVRDGVVTLTLLLGKLGEIEVLENEIYSDEVISSVFEDMLTIPVTSDAVEEKLYLINDYPGLSATGFFQPGAQVGDTKMNINVRSEKQYDANVRLDNHGSEQTGEYRLYGEVLWHNPLGNADQLHVAGLAAFSPDNTIYGQLRYNTRFFNPRLILSIGGASNDFVLGPGNSESINNLELEGDTKQTDVGMSYTLNRSRSENYYLDYKYEKVASTIRLGALPTLGDVGLDDTVINSTLGFRYDILDEENKILHQGDVLFTSGEFEKGVEVGQDESYNIFGLNYTLLTFWQLPYFESNTRIIYRTSLQYASSAISSINQFTLAGPSKARAYSVNQFSADNAIYMGADWIFDAPDFISMDVAGSNLVDMIRPFIFVDASYGEVISLIEGRDNSDGRLIDAGFGFQLSYKNNLQGNLHFAFPLSDDFSNEDIVVEDDSMRVVFDLQYSFR